MTPAIPWNEHDYILWQSPTIVRNLDLMKGDLDIAHSLFKKVFPGDQDSTWTYHSYNIFAFTAPSSAFYILYKELRDLIRGQLGDDRQLWLQAWVNYHKDDQLINRHHHDFEYHGYISIDPKKTKTVFDNYEVINKPGQIYFGPGHRYHHVEAIEPFEGIRTTLGFDVHTTPQSELIKDYIERPFSNMGLMPLI